MRANAVRTLAALCLAAVITNSLTHALLKRERTTIMTRKMDQIADAQVRQRHILGVESLREFVVEERYVDQLRLLLRFNTVPAKSAVQLSGMPAPSGSLCGSIAHAPQYSSSRALLAHHRPPIFRARIRLFSKRKNDCRRLRLSTSAMPLAPQTKSDGSGFSRVSFEGVSVGTWDPNSCCFVPRRRALTSL
jgi:hypothetical protein